VSQFITENDMHRIKGLLHYLNESFDLPQPAGMSAEIALHDSNGEKLGVIDYEDSAERYVFFYA
jgi:hypothetical protein